MTVPALAASRISSLVNAYLAADYRWEIGGRWRPLPLGEVASDLESTLPQARSFGLLSAWNPYSVERGEDENRAADEQLSAALLESGLQHRPGFSSARNRSWREPSWLVMDMPEAGFDQLGRRFGQLATLYANRGDPMRLRVYHERPRDFPDHADVDWVR